MAAYRFADRFGVARIILVRLHVRPHEVRTYQPDLVTALGNLAGPIVCSAARLHRHQARSQLRHKRQQLPASELALHDCLIVPIHPVNVKAPCGGSFRSAFSRHGLLRRSSKAANRLI
jgi:hypothetical protein